MAIIYTSIIIPSDTVNLSDFIVFKQFVKFDKKKFNLSHKYKSTIKLKNLNTYSFFLGSVKLYFYKNAFNINTYCIITNN